MTEEILWSAPCCPERTPDFDKMKDGEVVGLGNSGVWNRYIRRVGGCIQYGKSK